MQTALNIFNTYEFLILHDESFLSTSTAHRRLGFYLTTILHEHT